MYTVACIYVQLHEAEQDPEIWWSIRPTPLDEALQASSQGLEVSEAEDTPMEISMALIVSGVRDPSILIFWVE